MHRRQVVVRILREYDLGAFGEMEFAIGAQMYRPRIPLAARHDDPSAAGLFAGAHGLHERRGAFGAVGLGAKIGDGEVAILEEPGHRKTTCLHIVEEQLRERRRPGLDRMGDILGRFAVLAHHQTGGDDEELLSLFAPDALHQPAGMRVHIDKIAFQLFGKLRHRIAIASQAHAIHLVLGIHKLLAGLVEGAATDRREQDGRRALRTYVLHPVAHNLAEKPLRIGPAFLPIEIVRALLVVVAELYRDEVPFLHLRDELGPHAGLDETLRRGAAAREVGHAASRLHRLLELRPPAVVGKADVSAPTVVCVIQRRVAREKERRGRRRKREARNPCAHDHSANEASTAMRIHFCTFPFLRLSVQP